MAKPILPDQLTLSMNAGAVATLFLEAKLREVEVHCPAALSGDVDGVHDMRVAIKRLREAMRLFRELLPRKRRRHVMLMVEELNDALGRVRDPDVMREHAQWLADQVPADRPALDAAIASWTDSRAEAHAELLELWDRLERSQRFRARVEEMLARLANKRSRLNRMPVDRYAYLAVTTAAERVSRRLSEALGETDPTVLHRLRISVKRLKYSCEPFLQLLPLLQEPYKVVSDTQEALGLTHDFDVLAAALQAHMSQSDADDGSELSPGSLDVIATRRAEHHDQARRLMESLADDRWRLALLDVLD